MLKLENSNMYKMNVPTTTCKQRDIKYMTLCEIDNISAVCSRTLTCRTKLDTSSATLHVKCNVYCHVHNVMNIECPAKREQ